MSIGCDAEMSMRFKTKYHFAHKLKSYDPTVPIYVGFQEYESRLKLKAMYDNGHTEEYEAAEKALLKKVGADKKGSKKKPPVILKMHLKHGDMVVMSGDQLQRMTEV